jgi:predicted  nucleic acid-binding Zn-ribbon protein
MREQLDRLYELQQIDTTIDDATRRLAGLDDGSTLAEQLRLKQGELAAMEQALKDKTAEQWSRESELEATEQERTEKWSQAYGGRVSDPKELSSLEKKISELQRRADKLEDQILEIYDSVEQQTAQVETEHAALEQRESELSRVRAEFHERAAQLKDAISQAQERREGVVAQLDPGLLADYESIREKTGGLAVALVSGQVCRGCRTSISVMFCDELRKARKVVRCESCRRILYDEEWT